MSKFFYRPTVGIDVSADFSIVAILALDDEVHRKLFRIKHNRNGFDYLVDQIRKVESNKKDALTIAKIGKFQNVTYK